MTKQQLEALREFGITQVYGSGEWYELDCTAWGDGSPTYGGSYYTWANHDVLQEEFDGVRGFSGLCRYPDISVCTFNIEKLSEEDADRLIYLLKNASTWRGFLVIDEELAWELEDCDAMSALEKELESFLSSNNLRLEDGVEMKEVLKYMLRANTDGRLFSVERGPRVLVNSEVFAERLCEDFYEPIEDVETV